MKNRMSPWTENLFSHTVYSCFLVHAPIAKKHVLRSNGKCRCAYIIDITVNFCAPIFEQRRMLTYRSLCQKACQCSSTFWSTVFLTILKAAKLQIKSGCLQCCWLYYLPCLKTTQNTTFCWVSFGILLTYASIILGIAQWSSNMYGTYH